LNTLINDPDAPAEEMPNGNTTSLAGVLGGNTANRGGSSNPLFNEELINHTLAQYPGGAEAFWEGMQGNGIGREEFMQLLANEMFSFPHGILLISGAVINRSQFLKLQVNLNNLLCFHPLHSRRLHSKLTQAFRQTCNLNLLPSRPGYPVPMPLELRDQHPFHLR
jgi:hypothetical protein